MLFKEHLWARKAFTQFIRGESITPIQLTASEAQSVSFGWVFKQPENKTSAQCKKIYHELLYKLGVEDGRALLQRFGIASIDKLYIGSNDRFYEYARKAIDFGLSPHHPWDIDCNENYDLRTRWLIRDAKDGELFETFGLNQAKIFLRSAYYDVTGDPVFEEEYARLNPSNFNVNKNEITK